MALTRISVGLDGSECSRDALRWAAAVADSSSASLRAISSWTMPLVAAMPKRLGGLPTEEFMAQDCAETLQRAVDAVDLQRPVEQTVRHGDPGAVLVQESSPSTLVVVGRTGVGRRHGIARVAEIVLGSTARHCIHEAPGPVAVVPMGSTWSAPASVVVGMDGSASAAAALGWAVDSLPSDTSIRAVRAIPPFLEGLLAVDRGAIDRIVASSEHELTASVSGALAGRDQSTIDRVTTEVLVENARFALTKPERQADVVIVGARGRNAMAARMLGSISDHVVRNAPCPVVVVPVPGTRR